MNNVNLMIVLNSIKESSSSSESVKKFCGTILKDIGQENIGNLTDEQFKDYMKYNTNNIINVMRENKPLFMVEIGELLKELKFQIYRAYPGTVIEPRLEVYGYYSECNYPYSSSGKFNRMIPTDKFSGLVTAVFDINKMIEPIYLGNVGYYEDYGEMSEFVDYKQVIRRWDVDLDFKKYETHSVDMLEFLVSNVNHPCFDEIENACIKIIDRNLVSLKEEDLNEEESGS